MPSVSPRVAWHDQSAAQLVEFAVALPLLVVFVVGIFDFSGAYTLKQKLTNIARDAARTAAGDPSNDLQFPSAAAPASVLDAFQMIDNYLIANNINDCGIISTPTISGLTWTFANAANGCLRPGLTIIINRGYYLPASGATLPSSPCVSPGAGGAGTVTVIATCVNIQYTYPWRFGRAASLLGFRGTLPTQITATSVALNEN